MCEGKAQPLMFGGRALHEHAFVDSVEVAMVHSWIMCCVSRSATEPLAWVHSTTTYAAKVSRHEGAGKVALFNEENTA